MVTCCFITRMGHLAQPHSWLPVAAETLSTPLVEPRAQRADTVPTHQAVVVHGEDNA